MAKIVMVIANNFRDEELFHTKEEIEKAGHFAIIASKTKGEKIGMLDGKAKAEIDLATIKEQSFDAIVFVGGTGSETYFNDATALRLAKEFAAAGKIVAAICIAPAILANAGILQGKKATCAGNEKILEINGAKFTGNAVEADGKIITGKGPAAAREFGKKIAEMLE